MNAETVDNAGIENIVMLVTVNTNDLVSPEVLCSSSSGEKKASSTGGYKRQAHTT